MLERQQVVEAENVFSSWNRENNVDSIVVLSARGGEIRNICAIVSFFKKKQHQTQTQKYNVNISTDVNCTSTQRHRGWFSSFHFIFRIAWAGDLNKYMHMLNEPRDCNADLCFPGSFHKGLQ